MPNANVIDNLMASIQDSLNEQQMIQTSLDQSLQYELADDEELLAELQQLTSEETPVAPAALPKETDSMENLLQGMNHLEIEARTSAEQNSELNTQSLILE
jgi:hypothetical protein